MEEKQRLKLFEKHWQNIEKEMNWQNIYEAMKLTNWTWKDYGIPSVNTLKKSAYDMCKEVWEKKNGIASGGFYIEYDKDKFLSISFVLEGWATDSVENED